MSIVVAPAVNSLSADSSQSKYAPEVAPKNLTSTPVSSTPNVVTPSICTVPSMSTASRFVVPSMSALPLISNVAASSSPDIVIFLPPVISLLESVIIALLAITVPFVIPSIRLMSAALAVTPSSIFNSAAVEVTPSIIFNSAAVAVIAVPLKFIASA